MRVYTGPIGSTNQMCSLCVFPLTMILLLLLLLFVLASFRPCMLSICVSGEHSMFNAYTISFFFLRNQQCLSVHTDTESSHIYIDNFFSSLVVCSFLFILFTLSLNSHLKIEATNNVIPSGRAFFITCSRVRFRQQHTVLLTLVASVCVNMLVLWLRRHTTFYIQHFSLN